MPLARAAQEVGDLLALDDSKVYDHAAKWRAFAQTALDAWEAGAADLVFDDDVLSALDEAGPQSLPKKTDE